MVMVIVWHMNLDIALERWLIEYVRSNYTGNSLSAAANVIKYKILDSIPWKCWIQNDVPIPIPQTADYQNVIGLFEGANYYDTGWYRPSINCIMRSKSTGYSICNVCKEYLTYKILSYRHSTFRKTIDEIGVSKYLVQDSMIMYHF